MKLQVTGTILKVVTETGVSSKGNEWTKHNVVIVDSENKELQITFFDSQGNFSYLPKSEGETLIAECELTSREYKGKYYTQVNGLGILNKKKESVYKAVVQGKELTAEFDRKVIEDDLPF